MACSDYNFKGPGDVSEAGEIEDTAVPPVGEEPSGAPLAVVSPGAVDLGIVCGTGASDVTVENQGDRPLDVTSIDTNSPSWAATHDALPVTLGPGAQMVITVSGSAVDTTMAIETTDPAHPRLEVPLTATADAAPTVSITSPATGTTLDVGAITAFEASVADDAGAADAVSMSWTSDLDGLLDTSSADGAGVASFEWDGTARSAGTHVVTVTATDTCGNVAEADVVICQNEGYLAENLDLATWNFEGSASWDSGNNWVELTQPITTQSGTAFQTSSTVDSANVQIEFDFFVSGGTGADGMSVTALDSTRMTSFVGDSGGGMGYGGLPGWSIEVDTWYNEVHADPTTGDHVSLHLDGNVNAPVVWAPLPEMEDGNWHRMSVNVLGTWITVTIDGSTYIDQDVSELTSFPAYVGFTAATGAVTNYHLIDALEVEEFVCE
jgi:hypothetical protein